MIPTATTTTLAIRTLTYYGQDIRYHIGWSTRAGVLELHFSSLQERPGHGLLRIEIFSILDYGDTHRISTGSRLGVNLKHPSDLRLYKLVKKLGYVPRYGGLFYQQGIKAMMKQMQEHWTEKRCEVGFEVRRVQVRKVEDE